MNSYQEKLWNDLMALTESSEAFYYVDQSFDNYWFRIFNYRLASYTDFLAPSALECRGTMFEVSEEGKHARPLRLAALPMEKFFNKNENPMTMDLDFLNPMQVMLKEDGSLISTYTIPGHPGNEHGGLNVKSKGSLASDQAVDSMDFLIDNDAFRTELFVLTSWKQYTVNLEWTAPHNRIVIGYETPNLVVLNVRDRGTGKYIPKENLTDFPEVQKRWVKHYHHDDMTAFVENIVNETDIEGYVIQLSTGQHVKVKTSWYLALHHTKDSITNPRRLFECVLEETSDDLRTLFADDKLAIRLIEEMEQKVDQLYNHVVDMIERFYERNKHLERKDYAILAQNEVDKMWFSLAMNKYINREFSYKDYIKGKWKQLGFKDEKVNDE